MIKADSPIAQLATTTTRAIRIAPTANSFQVLPTFAKNSLSAYIYAKHIYIYADRRLRFILFRRRESAFGDVRPDVRENFRSVSSLTSADNARNGVIYKDYGNVNGCGSYLDEDFARRHSRIMIMRRVARRSIIHEPSRSSRLTDLPARVSSPPPPLEDPGSELDSDLPRAPL